MDSLIIAIITNIKKAFGNVRFFPALCRLLCNYRGTAPWPWGAGAGVGRSRGEGGGEEEGRELGFAKRQGAAPALSLRAGALLRPLPVPQRPSSRLRPGSQSSGETGDKEGDPESATVGLDALLSLSDQRGASHLIVFSLSVK